MGRITPSGSSTPTETYGAPVALGSANATGSATTVSRSDHVHEGGLIGGFLLHTTTLFSAGTRALAVQVANRAHYLRCVGSGSSIGNIGVWVGTSSGNMSAAICTGATGRANPTTRQATTGAIVTPASGFVSVALTAAYTPVATNGNWLALSADNATATFGANESQPTELGNLMLGIAGAEAAAHPVPATVTPIAGQTTSPYMLIGLP